MNLKDTQRKCEQLVEAIQSIRDVQELIERNKENSQQDTISFFKNAAEILENQTLKRLLDALKEESQKLNEEIQQIQPSITV